VRHWGDSAEKPKYVETVARRGYRFIGQIEYQGPEVRSLAVLPLENLSRDPEQDYFADGLTEALITALAKITDLRVVSRTSAMQYKGVHKPLREIGRELEVDTIIEGTVLRSGRRVRITAQLMNAREESHLWAETYERDLRHILALQADVAQAIAREIRVKLTPIDRARLGALHPVDPGAYEAYLKGRYHWAGSHGIRMAIQYFEQAITLDPTYAASYAGLADCFCALMAWGHVSPNEGRPKAKELAQKALAMDGTLAEAHTSLALATMYEYDFPIAEKEFERAIELNPRYATAHHLFGFYLGAIGRYEESFTELQRAIRLDPRSPLTNSFLGYIYLYARRYDQAIDQFGKTLKLESNSVPALSGLGWAFRCKLLHDSAIAASRKAVEIWPTGVSAIAWLGEAYAAAGYTHEARRTLEGLNELSSKRYVSPYSVARIYATLTEIDEALRLLETAYEQRAGWMVLLKVDPCFDEMRSHVRFADLMSRMSFPG
jgi:TolB-like protein/cytochrome c-type biogenesis protein CcmH/NrfG